MRDRKNRLLILLLLASSTILMIFAVGEDISSESIEKSPIDPHSQIVEEKMNRHLKLTAQKIELEKLRAQIATGNLPKVGEKLFKDSGFPKGEDYGVQMNSDPNEDRTYRDLNRHPKDFGLVKTADSVIKEEKAQEEMLARQLEAERREYARQFIENARRAGYELKVSDDFVVTGVRKIQPERNALFNNPGESGAK